MSHAYSPYGTVAALKAFERIPEVGPDRLWNSVSAQQSGWLDRYVRMVPELARIPEIVANATFDAQNHVDFLKKHGWEAQIKKCGQDEFLTAAVLDVLGKWLTEGREVTISRDGREFPAACISRSGDRVLVRKGTNERYVHIATEAGDSVWLEPIASAPDGLALAIEAADRFREDGGTYDGEFDGVVFPMIDFSGKNEQNWLQELWTTASSGRRCKVKEAKQQVELKASHLGIRARSADEMLGDFESCMSTCKPPFYIKEPFLIAITRSGLSLPLFAAHVTPDAWKDPGDFGI